MKAYRLTMPSASFVIYPKNGWWGLMINGEKVDDYATPEAAAYDVGAQNTGYTGWDLLEDVDAPESLQDWDTFPFEPGEYDE